MKKKRFIQPQYLINSYDVKYIQPRRLTVKLKKHRSVNFAGLLKIFAHFMPIIKSEDLEITKKPEDMLKIIALAS